MANKVERLVNLVFALLSTRQYLTAEQIRDAVPGYDDDGDVAFKRMFERDKLELRELGIPIETGSHSAWDDEPGYRIGRRDYDLPDLHLEPDEAAALGLAARLWQTGLADAATTALVKLRALGVDPDPDAGTLPGLEPRIDAADPALAPCVAAVRTGSALTFGYRSAAGPAPEQREVEPWGVVSWRGHWYLVGHDRRRAATRVFRLSRMSGAPVATGPAGAVVVPPGTDVRGLVLAEGEGPPVEVEVALVAGRGPDLRRRGEVSAGAGPELDGAPSDLVRLSTGHPSRLAEELCALGPDAVVLAPAELRADVVSRLRAVLAATA